MLDHFRRTARWAVWLLLGLLIFASLSSIQNRPHLPYLSIFGANLDRFVGFFVVTAAFGLAYPIRLGWLAFGLIVMAIGLEFAQTLVASRHGRASDALVKIAAVMIATLLVAIGNKLDEKRLQDLRLR